MSSTSAIRNAYPCGGGMAGNTHAEEVTSSSQAGRGAGRRGYLGKGITLCRKKEEEREEADLIESDQLFGS